MQLLLPKTSQSMVCYTLYMLKCTQPTIESVVHIRLTFPLVHQYLFLAWIQLFYWLPQQAKITRKIKNEKRSTMYIVLTCSLCAVTVLRNSVSEALTHFNCNSAMVNTYIHVQHLIHNLGLGVY